MIEVVFVSKSKNKLYIHERIMQPNIIVKVFKKGMLIATMHEECHFVWLIDVTNNKQEIIHKEENMYDLIKHPFLKGCKFCIDCTFCIDEEYTMLKND